VLIASSEGAATVPTSVKIPAGKTSVTFTVKTVSVAAQTVAKITASLGAASQSADLTINPPAIVSLTLSPAAVVGGDSSTGKVTIGTAAPAGGLVVSLSRSNTADSMVPATVTVPAGKTSATFTITTKEVTAQTTSTITAALGPTSKSASLTIKT